MIAFTSTIGEFDLQGRDTIHRYTQRETLEGRKEDMDLQLELNASGGRTKNATDGLSSGAKTTWCPRVYRMC
jgi:hypothetical protein